MLTDVRLSSPSYPYVAVLTPSEADAIRPSASRVVDREDTAIPAALQSTPDAAEREVIVVIGPE